MLTLTNPQVVSEPCTVFGFFNTEKLFINMFVFFDPERRFINMFVLF